MNSFLPSYENFKTQLYFSLAYEKKNFYKIIKYKSF